jgi:hypothetical protein
MNMPADGILAVQVPAGAFKRPTVCVWFSSRDGSGHPVLRIFPPYLIIGGLLIMAVIFGGARNQCSNPFIVFFWLILGFISCSISGMLLYLRGTGLSWGSSSRSS